MFVERLREIAERDPEWPALVTSGRELSYGELLTRVDQAAAGFAATGLRETGTVGLSIGDEIEHLIACLGLMAAGYAQVTLATFDPPEAKANLARAAGVDVVLCDDRSQAPEGMRRLRWTDIDRDRKLPRSPRPGRLMLRTSGTTGIGKLVAFDETQLALQARDTRQYAGARYLRPASVEHNNGKRHRLYCLYAGGTNVFRPPFEPDFARTCTEFGVSLVDLSLMHAEDLVRRDDRTPFRHTTIRTAGSALPFRMRQLLQERVSKNLYVRYGTTECATIAMAGPDQHDQDEVVGLPSAGVEIRIVDDGGAPVAANAPGRIGIKAPGMATGYLSAPAEAAKRFVDGWFYPDDIGRFRADGCLIVQGRADEMMILNGLNIFPQEIERVLQLHPAVKAAAAVALASPVHGQIPVAAVELEAGGVIDTLELLDFARERLGLRAPRRIVVLGALPRAAEGKILRRAVLSAFERTA